MPILPIDTGRYGTSEMRRIFEEESRLQKILDVEAAVAYAHAQVGNVPKEVAEEIIEGVVYGADIVLGSSKKKNKEEEEENIL